MQEERWRWRQRWRPKKGGNGFKEEFKEWRTNRALRRRERATRKKEKTLSQNKIKQSKLTEQLSARCKDDEMIPLPWLTYWGKMDVSMSEERGWKMAMMKMTMDKMRSNWRSRPVREWIRRPSSRPSFRSTWYASRVSQNTLWYSNADCVIIDTSGLRGERTLQQQFYQVRRPRATLARKVWRIRSVHGELSQRSFTHIGLG